MKTVELEGVRIAYWEKGTGEPIILLHGYPQNHLAWRHQFEALASNYRVVSLDWVGSGKSDRPTGLSLRYEDEVERLKQFMDAVGISEANVFAHDYGGFLACGLATRYPERIKRLAVLNSRAHGTFACHYYVAFRFFQMLCRLPFIRSLLQFLPLYLAHKLELKHRLGKKLPNEIVDEYLGHLKSLASKRWLIDFFSDGYEFPSRSELAANLGQFKKPVAVIWGLRGTYVPNRVGNELSTLLPRAKFYSIPEAGHFVMEEEPEKVLSALNELLQTT